MNARGLTMGLFLTCVVTLASCQRPEAPPVAPPPTSTPKFKYVKQKEGGCHNLHLYKGSADDLEVLRIWADKEKLKIPDKGTATFDLAEAPAGLEVDVDLWEKAPRFHAYCNDISPDTKKIAVWKAKKGKLIITTFPPEEKAEPGRKTYKASARLEKVVFDDGAGHEATLMDETITDVFVGWIPG
jgi:hypothetical protein